MNNSYQNNIHTWTYQGRNFPHLAKIIQKIGDIVLYTGKTE